MRRPERTAKPLSPPNSLRKAGIEGAAHKQTRRPYLELVINFRAGGVQPQRTKACAGDPAGDLRRNPWGWGRFSPFRRRSSLEDSRSSSLLAPGTAQNRLPAPHVGKLKTGSRPGGKPGNAVNGKLELDKTNGDGDCHAGYSAQSRRGIRQELRDAIEHPRGSQACGE